MGRSFKGQRAVSFCSDYREGAVISEVTVGGPPGPACPAEVETKAEAKPRGTAEGVAHSGLADS
jgi:hypothetical protein